MSADSGHGGHGWFLTLHRWAVDRHEAMPLLAEHRAWVLKQHRAGNITISGPSADRSLGIMVVRARDAPAASQLLSEEPWLGRGMRTVEIIPWDVHELLGVDLHAREGMEA